MQKLTLFLLTLLLFSPIALKAADEIHTHQFDGVRKKATWHFHNCQSNHLADNTKLREVITKFLNKNGCQILAWSEYINQADLAHGGHSMLIVLPDGHVQIDVYPENHLCVVEVFSCDPPKWTKLTSKLRKFFESRKFTVKHSASL